MSECVETCVDFNAKIGGNSRPEWVVYKQVKSKRHINEVPSYEMTQCADIIRAFLSLSHSLEECGDLSAQTKMIKTRRERTGRDFSVFICFQNMCLAIYLFSAIKIQYPRAIIITTIRGGPLLHSPAKCRPRAASEIEICLRPASTRLGSMLLMLLSFCRELQWIFCQAAPQTKGFEVTLRFSPSFRTSPHPPRSPPLVSSSPRSFSKFNCARNLSFC